MWVGIGIGINRNRFARGIFDAYSARVVADGGITEAGSCVDSTSDLLKTASLLIIPSGYKGGKAYAEIPTNGNGDLTWTRASDAWRTNADGLIQRVPWNLFSYSQEFNNGSWGKTASSITANSTTAPDGTTTADSLIEDSTNALHIVSKSTSSVGGVYTVSVYAKPNGRNWMFISMVAASNYGAYFDVSNGVTGTVESNITSATITSVGNGWYRCVMTANTGASSPRCNIYTATANGTNSYQGNGTSGLYIWGAQSVEGSSAQTYFPTTDRLNVPRLSYMYGSCPALLLEPQRTNLLVRSNEFSNVGVWVTTNLTVSDNSQTGIDGNTTASLITTTSTFNLLNQQVSVTAGTVYTFSFYVKRGTMTDMKYRVRNVTGASDIIPPTSYYSQTNSSTFTRISVTITAPVGCLAITFYPFSDTGSIGTAILTQAQVEVGAYATTIIPTTSAQATRVADSFSRSNIYTNGLITSSGGTWFVELRGNIQYIRDAFSNGLQLADNNTSGGISGNGFIVRRNDTTLNRLSIQKVIAGVPTALFATATDTVKFAIKWNGTTADVFVNGTKEVSATAFTTTNMEYLLGYATDVPKFIQSMALYPTPLSDTDCTTITSL